MSFPDPFSRPVSPSGHTRLESSIFFLLLISHMLLVWHLPFFPTQDGPSHLYNLVILQDLLNGGKTWGNLFTHQLHAVPNLGFNIIAYPLLKLFSPLVVERIFISIYIVFMGASVPLFLRTFDKPPLPLSFLVFPVIFNFTLLMGFYSYAIAVPLFLLAFSLAWKIRSSSNLHKIIVFNLSGFTIYYFHLIPFVFYILSLIAIVISQNATYKDRILGMMKLTFIISPILYLFHAYLSKTSNTPLDLSYLLSVKRYLHLISELFLFSSVSMARLQMIPAALLMYIVLTLAIAPIKAFGARQRSQAVFGSTDKTVMFLLIELCLIYLVAPFSFGDGSLFNQRFPWVILLITLPVLNLPDNILFRRYFSTAIICVVTAFFVVNVAVLRQESRKINDFLKGVNATFPKAAFVMTYKTETPLLYPVWSRVDVLMHAASYYGIFTGCVDIGNYETGLRYFPVHFKDDLPVFPSPDQIAWKPATIDFSSYSSIHYILGWEMTAADKRETGKLYKIIQSEGRLTVWLRNTLQSHQ